jgi:iron complex transport system substrate-binding protein
MRHSLSLLAAAAAGLFAVPAWATDYPLQLDNCGMALTIAAPPQRVVAIKSTAAELLLALGL